MRKLLLIRIRSTFKLGMETSPHSKRGVGKSVSYTFHHEIPKNTKFKPSNIPRSSGLYNYFG
jgi:hypothetical protein